MKIRNIVIAGLSFTHLMLSISVLWLTLGWNVRKARKAFEKELVNQGMAKGDAKRLSAQYSKLKNVLINNVKGSIVETTKR